MKEVAKGSLFNRKCLEELDLSVIESKFAKEINILEPSEGLYVRPLSSGDYDAGFVELLSQLTDVGHIDKEQFLETFALMKRNDGMYYITVIEDCKTSQIIATGTLLIEQKFIHGCAKRGRLEDIVVSDRYRGKHLGKLLVLLLTQLSKELQCYKVTLDCKDSNRGFYEGLGYKKEEDNSNYMQIRFRK